MKGENGHDEGVTTLPSEDVARKKGENEKPKSSFSQPYMPPLAFI